MERKKKKKKKHFKTPGDDIKNIGFLINRSIVTIGVDPGAFEQLIKNTELISETVKERFIQERSEGEGEILERAYQGQLVRINELIDQGKVQHALERLLQIKAEIWAGGSEKIKFKLLTNIGVCYYKLDHFNNYVESFTNAFSLGNNSLIAFNNIISALIATEDLESGRKYLNSFLHFFPDSALAIGAKIRLEPETKPFAEIENEIPEQLRDNPEIFFALGVRARKLNLHDKALNYFQEGILRNPGSNLFDEQILATKLEKYQSNFLVLNLHIVDNETKRDIEELVSLIDKQLSIYLNTEIEKVIINLLIQKAIFLSVLGRFEAAIQCLDNGLKRDGTSPILQKYKGLILLYQKREDEGMSILGKILSFSDVPDVPSILAYLLKKKGKHHQAIELLEKFIFHETSNTHVEWAKGILLGLYIENNFKDKILLLEGELKKYINPVSLVNLAKIKKHRSEDGAKILLLEGKKMISGSTPIRDRFFVAEALEDEGLFDDAIELYETFVDKNQYSFLTAKLAELCHLAGNSRESLKILEKVRVTNGIQRDLVPLEIQILQRFRNYKKAKELAEQYFNVFPDNKSIRLKLIALSIRLDDTEQADKILLEDIDAVNLETEELEIYLNQLIIRKLRTKAYSIAFDYRRIKNDARSHYLYVKVLLQMPLTKEECEPKNSISSNTVVTLTNNTQAVSWYIVDSKNSNNHDELSTRDEQYSILKEKKLYETVKFRNSSTIWKIEKISNKYLFAFQESLIKLETIFSDQSPLRSFHTDELPQILQAHILSDNSFIKNFQLAQEYYKKGYLTIGSISEKFKKNPIDVWHEFTSIQKIGIRCNLGLKEELEEASLLLDKDKVLIADITSLLTIFALGIGDVITKKYGKISISPSTFDEIFNLKIERSQFGNSGGRWLEDLLEFTKTYTIQVPPNPESDFFTTNNDKLNDLLGGSFVDTLSLVKQCNGLLLTDDVVFKNYCNTEHFIFGISTQFLLRQLFLKKFISPADYHQHLITLLLLNYSHISVDKFTIFKAAEMTKFTLGEPFISCVRMLSGTFSSNDSSMLVAVGFLFSLWSDEVISITSKKALTVYIISVLCTGRYIISILKQFEEFLRPFILADYENAATLKPVALNIANEVHRWKEIHDYNF